MIQTTNYLEPYREARDNYGCPNNPSRGYNMRIITIIKEKEVEAKDNKEEVPWEE